MLQEVSVDGMNDAQLLSFCRCVFEYINGKQMMYSNLEEVRKSLVENWIGAELTAGEMASSNIKRWLKDDCFYGRVHLFDGDEYVPCELEYQERQSQCVKAKLPDLGVEGAECYIYPQLKRIVYVSEWACLEESREPELVVPILGRISIEEYAEKLKEKSLQIAQARALLKSLSYGE